MKLINLTPHSITLYSPNGVNNIPPSGALCRVRSNSKHVMEVDSIPVVRNEWGAVDGLPTPAEGTGYIVSMMVISALQALNVDRQDVFAPGTGPNDGAVRNSTGQVVGVTRLVTL